jgi:hypothetical protein
MAPQRRTERCAYRPRWRPVLTPRGSPPPSSPARRAPNRQAQRQDRALPPGSKSDTRMSTMGRTRVSCPSTSGSHVSARRPRQSARPARPTNPAPVATDLAGLDLPRLFSPVQAAEILRGLGLAEMTECALRTRAYRRQIPFHRNGRRFQFTASDLREIAEGQAQHPKSTGVPRPPAHAVARTAPALTTAPRRSTARTADRPPVAWRARRPVGKPTPNVKHSQ